MLPQNGPLVISIPGVSGVQIGAATAGAEVAFRWPYTARLGGFDLVTRSGTAVSLAQLRLRMVDDLSQELIADGRGLVSTRGLLFRGIPPLGLAFGGRTQSFQRIVRAGDMWTFQLFNDDAAIAVTPFLGFRMERVIA